MQNEPDYAAARNPIEYEIELRKMRGFQPTPLSDKELETIKRALLIAEKLMAEPSKGMNHAGTMSALGRVKGMCAPDVFKAMRAKLIEEIDHDNG